MVAQSIICSTLGEKWFEDHVATMTPPTNFFRNSSVDEASITVGGLRVIQLAEMIWNLRNVPGMDVCMRLICSGKIADGVAELEVGKLLFIHDKRFRVVEPTGVLGSDYDLEIDFDGIVACADTKCKLETTKLSDNTILNSLNQARKQLPKDRPGIVFVSAPQIWHDADENGFGRRLFDVAKEFLRQTKRVVSVKFHTRLIVNADGLASASLGLLEVLNDNHKFDKDVAWNFYRERSTAPDSWVSILKECGDQIK